MNAEIIAVGTELLLGQIVNTNAQYISQQCAALGINVFYQTVVGDNAERLRSVLEIARKRSRIIIITGGLGPTEDDLTRDIVAAFVGRGLAFHEPSLARIAALFGDRGERLLEMNKKQALMIEGCDPLPNDPGLAVGSALSDNGVHYILLPGPPKEMRAMLDRYAIPWLRSRIETVPLYSRMLKFAGIGESAAAQTLHDLIHNQSDPTIAPYAKEGEVALRLTTRAGSQAEADAKMNETLNLIRSRLGEYLYAEQDISLEEAVVALLKRQGRTLAAAESCTGGLIAERITSVPGSSAVFAGGIVCYTNAVKHRQLHVPLEQLEGDDAPGAVSAETAKSLAVSVRKLMDTDLSVSVTGAAGPDPSEGKPVGTVFLGIDADDLPEAVVFPLTLSGDRETIRLRAAKTALFRLFQHLSRRKS
jgi:nicotinamide-nucleotide amidase